MSRKNDIKAKNRRKLGQQERSKARDKSGGREGSHTECCDRVYLILICGR